MKADTVVTMDGQTEKDGSLGSVTESTAGGSEPGVGESETLVEGQIEGPFGEEGGACNGEDIMVEVLGSDVFVDGVCANDAGDGGGGGDGGGANLNDEVGCGRGGSVEVGLLGNIKSLDGGGGVVDNLGSGGTGVGSGVEGSLEATGSLEEQNRVDVVMEEVVVEVREEGLVEEGVEGVGILDGGAQNAAIGTGVEGSLEDVSSTGGETQVVEEIEVVVREEVLEGGNVKDGAERGRGTVGDGGVVIEEVGVLDSNAQNHVIDKGVGGSLAVAGSSRGETQLVVEEVAVESEEIFERGQAKEGAEQGRELVDGEVDAVDDLEAQKVDDEVWNPGIETAVVCTSANVENLSAQTKVVEEVSCSVEELEAKVEAVGGSTENHTKVSVDSVSSFQSNQVVVGGEVAAMTDKVLLNSENDQKLKLDKCLDKSRACDVVQVDSNIGQEMEVDKQVTDAEQVGLHGEQEIEVEDQQVKVETVNGNPEGHQNLKAETVCTATDRDTQVTDRGEEIALMDNESLGPAENNQEVELEECSDKSSARDLAQPELNLGQQMEVGEQFNDVEQIILHRGQEMEVEEQLVGVETVGGSTECHGNVCEDSISLCQPTQVVVGGEVAAVDDNSLSNMNMQVPNSGDLEEMLYCSGNDENLEAETVCRTTEIGAQVTDRGEMEIIEEGLDKNAAGNLSGVEPNMGQEMEDEEQVTDTELVDLHGGQDIEDEEQVTDTELVDLHGGQDIEVDEQVTDTELVDLHGGQDIEVEEQVSDTEKAKISERFVRRASLRSGSSVTVHQASYQLPSENEGEFSVSDLVWGKVRSHPWWPGQIFDPSDSSEKAIKYQKKDCFLVAYFGDRTFAWNDSSLLKPFRPHFSQIEKQSNSETFQNAVDCALEEVSRRVELGLACSCIPMDAYDKIKFQIVENTGIRQESSRRDGVDESANVNSFEPDKLVEYMKALAKYPSGGADRLELVIAKSQLLAFYRLKGYCQLPEFQLCGDLLENDADTLYSEDKMQLNEVFEHATMCVDDEKVSSGQEILKTQNGSIHKQKHNLKEGMYPSKKERSLSELMGGTMDLPDDENGSDGKATSKMVSSSSNKKRRAADSFADDSVMQDERKSISFAKITKTTSPIHRQSFKIGECIRRVASQLTGSPSILKSNSERFQKLDGSSPAGDGFDVSFEDSEDVESGMMIIPAEYSSLDDLLSQLYLAAQDPMIEHSFLNVVISFFSDFRNSITIGQYSAMDKAGGKRKKSSIPGAPETFEFEDMNDTYWTDRIIQNGSEEQPSRRKRRGEYQLVPADADKPLQVGRRQYSRKRYSDGSNELAAGKPAWYLDERLRDSYPAELIMGFSEVRYIPSEVNLIKMFRRFGPLKELETEVDRATSRARVVFKRCTDAEVAFNSAGKFNIFGPTLVNYQLSYSPSGLYKASPIATTEGQDGAI